MVAIPHDKIINYTVSKSANILIFKEVYPKSNNLYNLKLGIFHDTNASD